MSLPITEDNHLLIGCVALFNVACIHENILYIFEILHNFGWFVRAIRLICCRLLRIVMVLFLLLVNISYYCCFWLVVCDRFVRYRLKEGATEPKILSPIASALVVAYADSTGSHNLNLLFCCVFMKTVFEIVREWRFVLPLLASRKQQVLIWFVNAFCCCFSNQHRHIEIVAWWSVWCIAKWWWRWFCFVIVCLTRQN